MDIDTARKAIDLAVETKRRVGFGGGEPTLHPYFWELVERARKQTDDIQVTTNGKSESDALRLANMAELGMLQADLSIDRWHEGIDTAVIAAFRKPSSLHNDRRRIRNVERDSRRAPQKAGRCDWGVNLCPMEGPPFVDVRGNLHQCGCIDAPALGTVSEESARRLLLDSPRYWECYHPEKRWRLRGR